ncbi:MAG: hypothetical protein NWQ24_01155 [Haliea sp.]|nr:hypothetical protein [Haliea sp.]MDP4788680.1 hypothetical protein [Haliea sp.]MDP5063258.1 hypothetical protein [Haliea sp.]
MNTQNGPCNTFNPSTLCSRKLWRIVAGQERTPNIDQQDLQRALQELSARRTYLTELKRLGKLATTH